MSERFTPPSWMRHITPWWLLYLIDEHSSTCWAGMAMWKLGYGWSWWPDRHCFEPVDYCGKFDDGARFKPGQERA